QTCALPIYRLGAETPFQGAMQIRIERLGGEAHRLVQREVQAVERPGGVLEAVELLQERRRKLRAADVILEGLVHVERRGDELLGLHGAAVFQGDAGRLAAFDDDAVELDLRREAAARRDE